MMPSGVVIFRLLRYDSVRLSVRGLVWSKCLCLLGRLNVWVRRRHNIW